MLDVNDFDKLKIGLATADQIRSWSHGEVKKPETINYRTLKPEKDGLFCEKIFGPTRDWECYCGKYKRVRFKGIICERCGVEVTRARVRRERMGHIELAAPVAHIWYFKGVPSRMGYLLDITPKDLEKILYFASYVITFVDEEKRQRDLPLLEEELNEEIAEIEETTRRRIEELRAAAEGEEKPVEEGEEPVPKLKPQQLEKEIKSLEEKARRRIEELRRVFEEFKALEYKQLISDEVLFREMRERYGDYFRGGMGAEAVQEMLANVDLEKEAAELREIIRNSKGQKRQRATKRLKVVSAFLNTDNDPTAMILTCIPVIPPDLRPMVQLDGGRFATSDLNDLYRRVINRNNRLKRLLDLGAPEIIVNNEKRMLQEAVDALFDNGRRGRAVTGPGNRPLKSLSDMLKGKQGRFRQNLLGKRVDYSGRSVIVVGPKLKLHQCGLPKQMALELFKPFVMKLLVDKDYAQNIKSAKRMVERQRPEVWDVLDEVIREHPVLLNRAPTLHRLGIQAFEPVLVEGKAIQIHPLVCTAFNADFDGDQMAVHLPLSAEAQAESRILMLSAHNILSPAHGRPITTPTQDMVLGSSYLTVIKEGEKGEGKAFASPEEAIMAYEFKEVALHAPVKVRIRKKGRPAKVYDTSVGRVIFNTAFPDDYPFVNEEVNKAVLQRIVTEVAERYDTVQTAEILDNIKRIGFHYATRAGITIGISDITVPPDKDKILEEPEAEVERIEENYKRGLITDEERHQKVVELWTEATDRVTEAMEKAFDIFNPIYMMATSGARGNIKQIRQLAGMRGLVANPKGEIIDRPIKSNFREGLTVLEYFISTHGARKGLADTALRTADSGYLTRRLVDVSQEVIVREYDCRTDKGIPVKVYTSQGELNPSLAARVALERVTHPKTGEVLLEPGDEIDMAMVEKLAKAGIEEVMVRSVMTCESRHGVCCLCYGTMLATGRLVEIGEAVGIIAAQSIGEPGTQLTMRTFHTGGVAGEDITHGLPRVVELFEARKPKGQAVIAEISGKVTIEDSERSRKITITGADGKERVYQVSRRARLRVRNGQEVAAGDQLTEGSINPHDILRVLGTQAAQLYLVHEVQEVYKSQGVDIHDKHIELIVRQMMKKVEVLDPGDTDLLPGDKVDRKYFEEVNQAVMAQGGEPATARQMLLGITKASLATESFLSAASFQETTRVLTDAAISGKVDPLLGLKENVIIGKLIPAGTGMARYRNIKVKPKHMGISLLEEVESLTSGQEAERTAAVGEGGVELPDWARSAGSVEEGDGAEEEPAAAGEEEEL
ncbi:DNA-directed RNA polymerase subunit beta' [Candidatus Solincola tengchongensis]|uniref:DNA-directed RNA polymerase subunit beta' n=1 Tax=Candidatus Solincola tengchongensis TaxID=2900693 RepID=UPI00257A5A6D|nr:DNA-directed RNA polymerase subunit beta' [Candidatus Solincola tengchongensis]